MKTTGIETMEKATCPVLLSPNQVAATGILTEYAIRKGIAENSIPHVKIGNRFKVNYTKLLQMLDQC